MEGVRAQTGRGHGSPDYLAPQAMPETVFPATMASMTTEADEGSGPEAATDRQKEELSLNPMTDRKALCLQESTQRGEECFALVVLGAHLRSWPVHLCGGRPLATAAA